MDETQFQWTLSYVVILSVTTLTTLSTLMLSFKTINRGVSAVQYILYSLCRSYLIYSTCRLTFYIGVLCNWNGVRDLLDDFENGQLVGVRVIYSDTEHVHKEMFVLLALFGDIALLVTTFWVITMAHEMTRLIHKSMDRGRERERQIVRNYNIRTYGAGVVFGSAMVFSAWLSPRQEKTVRSLAFAFQLACVWISFIYPLYCTVKISFEKRTHTVIHPDAMLLHQRIKNLVIVYCVLVFPACLVELLIHITNVPIVWVGLSQGLYYLSGAGTAFVIGVSVTCCYRTLQPIMPVHVYEHLLEKGFFRESGPLEHDMYVEAPVFKPIFVCTDIEGSTALWAKDPQAMSEAQSLHDDLLREALAKFRGYEITTCGDAFQLAFHNVSDAIAWCAHIQERLLKAPWPAALAKIDATARQYDMWGRLIFNGLRVRMAIHSGDDKLICSKHPTTGKMTYLGISEIVAREMGDMGRGGQILISECALKTYGREVNECPTHRVHQTFKTDRLEHLFERPELEIVFPIYEITVHSLGERFRKEHDVLTDIAATRFMMLRH